MNDLTPIATVILAAAAMCIPPAAVYILMDKSDDPRPEGRADK